MQRRIVYHCKFDYEGDGNNNNSSNHNSLVMAVIKLTIMMITIRFVDMEFKHTQRQNDKRYQLGCTVTSFLKH